MKKLYRSRHNRMIGGVCGGIAEYFNIDPVIVRIVAVAFFFMGGSALLAYVIGLIVIPNEPFDLPAAEKQESAPVTVPAGGSGCEKFQRCRAPGPGHLADLYRRGFPAAQPPDFQSLLLAGAAFHPPFLLAFPADRFWYFHHCPGLEEVN